MVDTNERGGAWRIGDLVMGGRSKVMWAALLLSHGLLELVVPAMDDLGHEVALASCQEVGVRRHAIHEVLITGLGVRKPEVNASFPMVEQ